MKRCKRHCLAPEYGMPRANHAVFGRPSSLLCRRYLFAVLVDVPMPVNGAVGTRDRVVRWGIGALSSGELEFLGAWPGTDSGTQCWQAIADDLRARGVESIRFLAGSNPVCIERGMRWSFPDVKVLLAAADCLRQGGEGLAGLSVEFASPSTWVPRHYRIVRRTIEAANQWAQRLNCAVVRQGGFFSLAAATAFAREALIRAQRDYNAPGPKTVASPVRAAVRSIRQPGMAALSR